MKGLLLAIISALFLLGSVWALGRHLDTGWPELAQASLALFGMAIMVAVYNRH